ncbi:hypothetical protein ARMGADRAFT_1041126, partial [Armillaria gallica]
MKTEYDKQLFDLHHDIDAAIQREFDIRMQDKVTNVRIDIDVECRDLEKQIQDLRDTQKHLVEQRLQEKLVVLDRELEKKLLDLGKEANDAHETRVEARRSQHEEKKRALSVDIQAAWARQGAASASQMEAYDHVSKQLAAIKEDHSLTMKSMTEDALATLRGLRDGCLRDSTQGNEGRSSVAFDHGDLVVETFPPASAMPAEIGNDDAASANEGGKTNGLPSATAKLPATSKSATDQGNTKAFKRCKAGRAGFHATKPTQSLRSNIPSPSVAGSSQSSARNSQSGRHAGNAPAAPPCVPEPAGEREHDAAAKGRERYHGHGRSASSDGTRSNASDADSDDSPPPPEHSAMKDFPPEFVRWMSNVNRILEQQAPSVSRSSSPVRQVEKKRAGPFRAHISSKKHSSKGKWILGEVRRLCWEYLDIQNGCDVVFNGIGASPEEVEEYKSGGPTPLANPMRPDWGSLTSRWNLDLAEAFYVQFCKDAENPAKYEFSKNDILVAFENKLKYLRGYVNKAAPLRNETSAQALERFNASLKHRRDISRPTQRRLT